jgi:hypothetical protein
MMNTTISEDQDLNTLINSLDKSNMTNKHHYKNLFYLSQRIQYKINQLRSISTIRRQKRKEFYNCSNSSNSNKYEHEQQKAAAAIVDEDDDLLLLISPTETMIAYYDEYYDHNYSSRGMCIFAYIREQQGPAF